MNKIQTIILFGIFIVMLMGIAIFGLWYQADTGISIAKFQDKTRASLNFKELQRIERKKCLESNPHELRCCNRLVKPKLKDLLGC